MGMSKPTGTREWASSNVNCVAGCSHRCRYCYAMGMALRFGRIHNREEWGDSYLNVNKKAVNQRRTKKDGTIMFPSSHDITPEILEPCMVVLGKLLKAGNNVLIVSKPHRECIEAICKKFVDFRHKILFRFTISAMDNELLRWWEPGAPSFEERLWCLRYAFENSFQTSVSAEPMLDVPNAIALYEALIPFITDSIWFGKMNRVMNCVRPETEEEKQHVQRIIKNQTDEKIIGLFKALCDQPKVRWKDSIKEIMSIEKPKEIGLDI